MKKIEISETTYLKIKNFQTDFCLLKDLNVICILFHNEKNQRVDYPEKIEVLYLLFNMALFKKNEIWKAHGSS